jgi:hypothetical protein
LALKEIRIESEGRGTQKEEGIRNNKEECK